MRIRTRAAKAGGVSLALLDYAGPHAMSELSSLLTLAGRLEVHALAQLVGMSVEDLAAAVIQAPRPHTRAGTTPPVAVMRPPSPMAVIEPPLAAMLGRATTARSALPSITGCSPARSRRPAP